ncbi:MAG: cysteine desulfurase [Acidobacteria bacterium]|nr:cysteine desulfurase [Acidobacteriota bacterium]
MSGRIYFDHSATTPLDPRVRQAMAPFLDGIFGNPSSQHREGRQAREAIEKARAQVGALIGASPTEIVFTASGTEADNLAILGVVRARGGQGHVITSAIEHPAVLETCRHLEGQGVAVTYLPVDQYGLVNPENVRAAIRPDTCLVSIMAASNLVGTIQPLAEIARITREHGILFHTDAVQALGKIPLDVRKLPVDLISMSAHKLHGPKGIGALYIRRGVELSPVVFGGGQERGLRSATENVAGIVGFGAAAIIAQEELPIEALLLRALRERVLEGVRAALPQAYLFGHPETRLPGHLSLGFAGEESRVGKLLEELDNAGISVSAGSACSAHHAGNPSQALLAMGYNEESARGLLRVTLGRFNTREEVDRFLQVLPGAVDAGNAEDLLQAAGSLQE